MEAGEAGISIKKIARHVFNEQNSFFVETDYDSVRVAVRQYLQRQCVRRDGLVRRVSHGVYQFNAQTQEARQLMLQFKDQEESCAGKPQAEDQSLSLF